MKIRSLLLVALMASQVTPVMAMRNFITNVAKQASVVAGIAIGASMFAKVAEKHPYLVAGFLGSGIGSLWLLNSILDTHGRDIQNKIDDIHFKIGCYRRTISPEQHLLGAVKRENLKEAQLALNRGANPNARISNGYWLESPLVYALRNEQMLDLLIKNEADVNIDNYLYYVMNTNGLFNRMIAKKLIEAGANPDMLINDGTGRTVKQFALIQAARTGNQDYINIFKPESKLL